MAICYICEENKNNLEEHHLIPEFMTNYQKFSKWHNSGGKIKLCPNCHEKIHSLMKVLEVIFDEELEEAS